MESHDCDEHYHGLLNHASSRRTKPNWSIIGTVPYIGLKWREREERKEEGGKEGRKGGEGRTHPSIADFAIFLPN